MIISLPSSPWFYRVLNSVLIALVAWLAAGLFWLLLAPAPLPPAAAPVKGGAPGIQLNTEALLGLFGEPANTGADAPSTLSVKLRGVIAAHDEAPAVAIFEGGDPRNAAVMLGGELESGVRLAEVAGDHVIIDNHGRRERLDLDSKAAAGGIETGPAAPLPAGNDLIQVMTPPPPTEPPQHAKGWGGRHNHNEQVNLSRKQVTDTMQGLTSADWSRGVAESSGGAQGLLLQNAQLQPLASNLGLQAGDVLQTVNGTPMTKKADIATLYSAIAQGAPVTVDIVRSGAQMTLHYSIEK